MMVDVPREGATADPWLEALYRREYRSLVRLAALLVDDRGTAEEVVQDAFVAVHLRHGDVADPDAVLPYLRSAVLNGARSALRKRQVRRRPFAVVGSQVAPSAEAGALASAGDRALLDAVRALPDRQRDCLVLRYWLDLTEPAIAETLGISVGSVKTHVHRGTAALARTVEVDR
jgi:RNA polymerase sigma-70 factor (sigma-E family)